MSIKEASAHFGLAEQTFYNKINTGELIEWTHYIKFGRKVLIIRENFIQWMFERSGGGHHVCSAAQRNASH